MKKFATISLTVVNLTANLIGIVVLASVIAKSEILHIDHLSDMANPSSGWYLRHPDTMLFAYRIPMLLIISIPVSLVSLLCTTIYLRIKKNVLIDMGYDPLNVVVTVFAISSLLALLGSGVTIFVNLYTILPIVYLYIALTFYFYKFSFVKKMVYRLGIGKK